MFEVDWTKLKEFIQNKGAEFQFLEMDKDYVVIARDSWFELKCYLSKSDPRNPDQADFEDNFKSLVGKLNKPMKQSSFTSKEEGGKKLFTRTHGKEFNLTIGDNSCEFTIPYPQVKFNAIEIIGTEKGDNISLQILDDDNGTVTTIPNCVLNQFGFEVGVPDGFYVRESKYDADLFYGLKIKIIYNSISVKDITVNYVLHELKA